MNDQIECIKCGELADIYYGFDNVEIICIHCGAYSMKKELIKYEFKDSKEPRIIK